jgi:predicted cobalt transporter CbtA
MPTYNEVGADFPAQLLFEFRMASLATQLALWAALGVMLAELAERVLAPTLGQPTLSQQVEEQGVPART